jgi:hypothetical protein
VILEKLQRRSLKQNKGKWMIASPEKRKANLLDLFAGDFKEKNKAG